MGMQCTIQPAEPLNRRARENGRTSHQKTARRVRRRNPDRGPAESEALRHDRGPLANEGPQAAPDDSGATPPDAADDESAGVAGSGAPAPTSGAAVRRPQAAGVQTVLNSAYELREIVVAQGIEHRNTDPWLAPYAGSTYGYQIPRGLQEHLPDNAEHEWARIDDTSAEFISHTQRVRYTIQVINTKDEYKRKLETPGLHVIYMGHSRYGRGQCFGPSPNPGEDWEQGTNTTGLFRTGYPVIGAHLSELREHGYSFYPVSATTQIRSNWYHPEIRRGNLHRIALPDDLQSKLLPVAQPMEEKYWASRDGEGETLLLWAGWTDTISTPMDLGAIEPLCRCWCIFSCSTRLHYWSIVRRRKDWRRTATDRFAYFTTNVSYPLTAWAWLRSVFEYSQPNDYQSWYPSLEWAKRRCGRILREEDYSYGIY